MSLNTDQCDCRRRMPPTRGSFADDWFPFCEHVLEKPGDFLWLHNRAGEITDLLIFIPGNEGGTIAPIPVARGGATQNPDRWGWDGNEDKPTLSPSIWRNKGVAGGRNEWHGHLENGRLVVR